MQMKEEAVRKKQSLHPQSWVSADKGSFFCDVGVLVAQVGMCPHHESRCSLSALRFWEFIKCQFILSKDIPRKVLKTTLERNGAGVGDVRSPELLFTRVIGCFNPFVHEPWQLGAFLASCGCDCSRLAFGTWGQPRSQEPQMCFISAPPVYVCFGACYRLNLLYQDNIENNGWL